MDFLQFTTQLNTEYQRDCVAAQSEQPWFGHFILATKNQQLAYKIGAARIDHLRIIDWRHPLSKGYFEAEPGDYFDLDDNQQTTSAKDRYISLAGDIVRQTSITNKGRAIVQATIKLQDGDTVVTDHGDGFTVLNAIDTHFAAVQGLPDIRALLTKAQYQLITTSSLQPVIIQGQAGSGKTTVALYRLSWLMHPESSQTPIDPANVLIVMFNKALQSFVADALPPLGLQSAQVATFHAWAFAQVKRAYNGNIALCTEPFAGASVAVRIKKQLGLLTALEEFVQTQTQRLYDWAHVKLQPYDAQDWVTQLRQTDQPIVRRLLALRATALAQRNSASGDTQYRLQQIYLLLNKALTRMTLYKEELLNFLTNRALLEKHLRHATRDDLETLSHYQQAMQSKGGTSRRPGPYVAFEDLALILRLIQLKHGGFPDKNQDDSVNLYDHLVIDEAQDFGALEMTVLLSAVRTRCGVTIVGDSNQKIIPEADFIGWDGLAEQLGMEGASVSQLEVAHRSTKPMMDLACSLINAATSPGRSGVTPIFNIVAEPEKADKIAATLNAWLQATPSAHICVICRTVSGAKMMLEMLRNKAIQAPLRLGHNNNFVFSPGVTITNARQIKGLEFDGVLLVDPTEEHYPNDAQGRKVLYTVITRAKDQLTMIASQAPCTLLTQAIDHALLLVHDQRKIIPITFTQNEDAPL